MFVEVKTLGGAENLSEVVNESVKCCWRFTKRCVIMRVREKEIIQGGSLQIRVFINWLLTMFTNANCLPN